MGAPSPAGRLGAEALELGEGPSEPVDFPLEVPDGDLLEPLDLRAFGWAIVEPRPEMRDAPTGDAGWASR